MGSTEQTWKVHFKFLYIFNIFFDSFQIQKSVLNVLYVSRSVRDPQIYISLFLLSQSTSTITHCTHTNTHTHPHPHTHTQTHTRSNVSSTHIVKWSPILHTRIKLKPLHYITHKHTLGIHIHTHTNTLCHTQISLGERYSREMLSVKRLHWQNFY